MAEEWDGETTFSPTNSSKEHLNAEQISQNNFWPLAEDIRCPEKQPIVFERRQDKIWKIKRETKELGTETRPGKGVIIEEVSKHQETLSLLGLGEVFDSPRAT